MATTAQELYDWLIANWPEKMTFRRVATLPGAPANNVLYYAEDTGQFSFYNGSEFQAIGGGDGIGTGYIFTFYPDLDTVSASITLEGGVQFSNVVISANLSSVTYEVKLSSATTYDSEADITGLNTWITDNAPNASNLFDLRLIATFSGDGEASATLK